MKQRPILFSGPMVSALLDGSKTQTRRVGKIQSPDFVGLKAEAVTHATLGCQIQATHDAFPGRGTARHAICACPYGKPGDQLWVRETWQGPLLEEYEVDADADWQSANRIHQYQNPAHCAFAADGGSPPEFIDSDGVIRHSVEPEFNHMSLKTPIGKRWLMKYMTDVYPRDYVVVNGVKTKPPAYYDEIFKGIDPLMFDELRAMRELDAELVMVDNSYDRLLVKEQVAKAAGSFLRRSL